MSLYKRLQEVQHGNSAAPGGPRRDPVLNELRQKIHHHLIEELGPIAGMRRSWRLVRGRFWPTLGIALLAGIMASFLGQVLSVVPTTVALLVGLRWGFLLLAAGGILVSLVAQPIVTIVATLLYFDARIRSEAFDLQMMAADLRS